MLFQDLEKILPQLFADARGRYRTTDQLCAILQESFPELWATIVEQAGPAGEKPVTGPVEYVNQALFQLIKRGCPQLLLEWLDSTGTRFDGCEPGCRQGWMAIWGWK